MERLTADPSEEAELARRIRNGDGAEPERQLSARMLPRMRLFLARHLRDPHTVEDASHDALLALLQALRQGRLEVDANVGAYAVGICRNLVRQHIRRDIRRHRALLREDRDEVSVFPEPRLRVGRLEECLHFLKERDRVLLRMTFVEGRSAGDAGNELGMTPQNVRVRRHRAIDSLRRCLGVGRYEAER
jgi:RNA polymerase sigma-70 factor (ECF subfamily)